MEKTNTNNILRNKRSKENLISKKNIARGTLASLLLMSGVNFAHTNDAIVKDSTPHDTKEINISGEKAKEVFPSHETYFASVDELRAAVADTLKGKKLTEAEMKYVKSDMERVLNVNKDTLSIKEIRVGEPRVYDVKAKKVVSKSEISPHKEYELQQNYYMKATLNPSEEQKYGDKLKTLDIDLTVQKGMRDQRHLIKIEKFGVASEEYTVGFNPAGTKLYFNNLMTFDVKGNDLRQEKIKSMNVTYDRESTKEKVQTAIEALPFELKMDTKVLEGLPPYMSHINLAKTLTESIQWSKQAKLENSDDAENDLKRWSRDLVIAGKTVKELESVKVEYDDDKIQLIIKQPEAKEDKKITHKVLGFDLQFDYDVRDESLTINIPTEGEHGLKAFKEHIKKTFIQLWDKLNKTHLGDNRVYKNLQKVPFISGNIAVTRVSPTIMQLDPSTGIVINFTSSENPMQVDVVLDVMKDADRKQHLKLKFVDPLGRAINNDYIKNSESSAIEMGSQDGGFKIKEFRGEDQPYTEIGIGGAKAKILNDAVASYNNETGEVVYRDANTLKEKGRLDVKVEDQGETESTFFGRKKLVDKVGYFYDEEKNTTKITADAFNYLLTLAPNKYSASIIDNGYTLGLSDREIYDKFREIFSKEFEGKDELKGMLVDGRYAEIESAYKGKSIEISGKIPEQVEKIIESLRKFMGAMYRLDTMEVIVSPDGRGKRGKNNRLLAESIGGETGIGRTLITGFNEYQYGKDNILSYGIIDGTNQVNEVKFTVTDSGRISLEEKEISIDGVPYKLSYDEREGKLYLIPEKEQL